LNAYGTSTQNASAPKQNAKKTWKKQPEPTKQPEKKPFEGYTKPCFPTEKVSFVFKDRETYQVFAVCRATLRQVYQGATLRVQFNETLLCPKCLK
jgi:hypothetical protein